MKGRPTLFTSSSPSSVNAALAFKRSGLPSSITSLLHASTLRSLQNGLIIEHKEMAWKERRAADLLTQSIERHFPCSPLDGRTLQPFPSERMTAELAAAAAEKQLESPMWFDITGLVFPNPTQTSSGIAKANSEPEKQPSLSNHSTLSQAHQSLSTHLNIPESVLDEIVSASTDAKLTRLDRYETREGWFQKQKIQADQLSLLSQIGPFLKRGCRPTVVTKERTIHLYNFSQFQGLEKLSAQVSRSGIPTKLQNTSKPTVTGSTSHYIWSEGHWVVIDEALPLHRQLESLLRPLATSSGTSSGSQTHPQSYSRCWILRHGVSSLWWSRLKQSPSRGNGQQKEQAFSLTVKEKRLVVNAGQLSPVGLAAVGGVSMLHPHYFAISGDLIEYASLYLDPKPQAYIATHHLFKSRCWIPAAHLEGLGLELRPQNRFFPRSPSAPSSTCLPEGRGAAAKDSSTPHTGSATAGCQGPAPCSFTVERRLLALQIGLITLHAQFPDQLELDRKNPVAAWDQSRLQPWLELLGQPNQGILPPLPTTLRFADPQHDGITPSSDTAELPCYILLRPSLGGSMDGSNDPTSVGRTTKMEWCLLYAEDLIPSQLSSGPVDSHTMLDVKESPAGDSQRLPAPGPVAPSKIHGSEAERTLPVLMNATLVESLGLELPELSDASADGFVIPTPTPAPTGDAKAEMEFPSGFLFTLAFTEKWECYNAQQLAWKISTD